MFVGLGHGAVGGGDHHHEAIDPGRAGDHRSDEALVPGDIDDRDASSRR